MPRSFSFPAPPGYQSRWEDLGKVRNRARPNFVLQRKPQTHGGSVGKSDQEAGDLCGESRMAGLKQAMGTAL